MATIRFENIYKSFETAAKPITVLQDISLEIHDQEFVAIVGPLSFQPLVV
jgi:ABC-type sugar transport system ATPase subunit